MTRGVAIISLLLLFFPSLACPGSPKEDFYDDAMSGQAVLDIQKMQRDELDGFISFLASCEAHRGGQFQEYNCDRDQASYKIKYNRGRAVDRIINVLKITWMWIESSDRTTKKGSPERDETSKAIIRYTNVMNMLKESANLRFQQLNKIK